MFDAIFLKNYSVASVNRSHTMDMTCVWYILKHVSKVDHCFRLQTSVSMLKILGRGTSNY